MGERELGSGTEPKATSKIQSGRHLKTISPTSKQLHSPPRGRLMSPEEEAEHVIRQVAPRRFGVPATPVVRWSFLFGEMKMGRFWPPAQSETRIKRRCTTYSCIFSKGLLTPAMVFWDLSKKALFLKIIICFSGSWANPSLSIGAYYLVCRHKRRTSCAKCLQAGDRPRRFFLVVFRVCSGLVRVF